MKRKPEYFELGYCVEGKGKFPLDMLRYDNACPASEIESHRIELRGKRIICLRRFARDKRPPAVARWKSFGWEVLDDYECIRAEIATEERNDHEDHS